MEPDIKLPFSSALIVQINDSTLWALDFYSEKSTFVTQNWSENFHSFDLYNKKTVYFGSSEIGTRIRSLSKKYPDLRQPGKWNAENIAVDCLNGKVYAIDGWAAKINMFDVLGENYSILLSDLTDSKDITLDPVQGFIFILQLSSVNI